MKQHHFVILGDTQQTMAYQVLMGRERNNHAERVQLIREIQNLQPDFLILLGDMVAYGQSQKNWNYFDEFMAPIREAGIPIIPVIGNHDYFVFAKWALKNLQSRFEGLSDHTWRSFTWNLMGFILLDSNQSVLKPAEWNTQTLWLQNTLNDWNKDPNIQSILIFSHHPPFTNSFEVGPHAPTRQAFLPPFFSSPKARIFITGHCHAYERFQVAEKTFIVSGGGGAPRQPLRQGRWQRTPDLYSGNRFRPFHYIHGTVNSEGKLKLDVRGLEKGQSDTFLMESIFI